MLILLSIFTTKCFDACKYYKWFSKICDHSYTTGEEIVELQQVCDSSVVPATYSVVGHVQESPPVEVTGNYSAVTHSQETLSSGVPTTYSSVVHVQVSQGVFIQYGVTLGFKFNLNILTRQAMVQLVILQK